MHGRVLYERNDLKGAGYNHQLAAELGELRGQPENLVTFNLLLACTRLAQGDSEEADAAIARADGLLDQRAIRPGIRAIASAYHGLISLRQNNLSEALTWSNRLAEYDGVLPFILSHIPARLLIAQGKMEEAAQQLKSVYEKAVNANAQGLVITIRIYQSLAAANPDEAVAFLTQALTLGEPEGFIRTFVDEGKVLAPLLRQALAQGVLPEYTGKLISIIEAEERQRRARSGAAAASRSTEPHPEGSEKTAGASAIFEGTIQAMVTTLETKDPYTAVHQRRVTDLCEAIATEMALPTEIREGLKLAAMVHDLGKISIPLDILNKPGKLTDHEFGLIKEHPLTGHEILKKVAFPYPIAEIVYQHHERMGGSGYPRGLKGDQVCLEARIIAVADVVEAAAAHRPYRPGRGIDFALAEITRDKGIGLDPDVVEACLKLFKEKSFKFE